MSRAAGGSHRNPLDPSVLREFFLAGLDCTQVRRALVGWPGQTAPEHLEIVPGQDVAVCVTTVDGVQLTARLFAGGSLWALPPIDDECLVLGAEGEWGVIGAPICLWRCRKPPSTLTETNAVLEVPSGGLLVGAGATANAARVGDTVDGGTLVLAPDGSVVGFVAPGGIPIAVPPGGSSIALSGQISANNAKTKVE